MEEISSDENNKIVHDGERTHPDGIHPYSESDTEFNTADLSNISGLSKVLRADDSIADRVRCLLEDDGDATPQEKPAFLDSSGSNMKEREEMKEKMIELFQEEIRGEHNERDNAISGSSKMKKDSLSGITGTIIEDNSLIPRQTDRSDKESNDTEIPDDAVTQEASFCAITPEGSTDSAGEVVPKGSSKQSSSRSSPANSRFFDDIMNLSDSTEYSDLPKVVDNPMKRNKDEHARETVANTENLVSDTAKHDINAAQLHFTESPEKISGKARFYVESDPNTPQCSKDSEKLLLLEKYMADKNPQVIDEFESGQIQFPNRNLRGLQINRGPVHSTPNDFPTEVPSDTADANTGLNAEHSYSSGIHEQSHVMSPTWKERSSEHNITIRSKGDGRNSPQIPLFSKSQMDAEDVAQVSLNDEDILNKVKKAVEDQDDEVNQETFSSKLRGPHTASEYSIASTVDSLALQVKNLLKEEESLIQEMDLTETATQDITQCSNFSDEISNFEKTSLWKYAQQFMPGVTAALPSGDMWQNLNSNSVNSPPGRYLSAENGNRSRSQSDVSSLNTSILRKIRESMRNTGSSNDDAHIPTNPRSPGYNINNTPTKSIPSRYVVPPSPLSLREEINNMPTMPNRSLPLQSSSKKIHYQSNHVDLSPTHSMNNFPREESHHSKLLSKHNHYTPPNPDTTQAPPSRIVGRYDSHLRSGAQISSPHERYTPLVPHDSLTPHTPYSFVTPKKVDTSAFGVDMPLSKYTTPIPSGAGLPLTNIPLTTNSSVDTPVPKESAYFREVPSQAMIPDGKLKSNPSPVAHRPKLSVQSSQEHASRQYRESPPSHVGDKMYKPSDTSITKPFLSDKITEPGKPARNIHIDKTGKSNGKHTSHSSPMPRSSSPKFVRFQEDLPPVSRIPVLPAYKPSSKSPLNPEYSFSTPRISGRSPATKSITPKVSRDKPRPPRVLPTYDQLVSEQENALKKNTTENTENSSPTKFVAEVESNRNEDEQKPKMLTRNGILKESRHPKKDHAARNLHNESISSEFLSLKPEICFDDSYQDVTVESLDSFLDREEHEHVLKSRRDLRFCYPTLGNSDIELHRRTLSPAIDSHQSLEPIEERPTKDSNDGSSSLEVNVPMDICAGPQNRMKPAPETRDSSTSPLMIPEEPEPAPLPFVRLCGKKKPSIPPRQPIVSRSAPISDEISQPRTKNRDVGVSTSIPVMNAESSNSDDDLLNLLETFSTKAPMMEKLLRKLYERSMQKKGRLSSESTEKWQPNEVLNKRQNISKTVIDQSMQTIAQSERMATPVLRTTSTNVPSVQRPNNRAKLRAVESSSQTSFTENRSIDVQTEDTSHTHNLGSTRNPTTVRKPLHETFQNSNTIVESKGKMTANIESDDIEKEILKKANRNKENLMRKKTSPCAFYVDLTPEKLSQSEVEEERDTDPVAWYEPYEYVPPWKRNARQKNKPALGFVSVNIQDAFLKRKRDFVIRSWERQEDIAIRAEERKLKDLEKKIQEQIHALHKETAEKLPRRQHKPDHYHRDPTARRGSGKIGREYAWKEMRQASRNKYENLPEVVARKREIERQKYYAANRNRALQYKKRISKLVVQRQNMKQDVPLR